MTISQAAHIPHSFHSRSQNHLLNALPVDELEQLHQHLELVPLPLSKVLSESGGKLSHVYFPTTAIISLLYVTEDGASAEIAMVGNDGLIGVALFMGGETMPSLAVVQSAGYAYRIKGELLKQAFNREIPMQHLFLRLYPGTAHANGANGGMQPAPFDRTATLSLAAA